MMPRPSNRMFRVTGHGFRRSTAILLFAAAATMAGPDGVDLPNTSIRLPWSAFRSLFERRPDTVFIQPKVAPPVAIAFGEMRVTAALRDSAAGVSLDMQYTVLAEQGWAEAVVLPSGRPYALSSVSLPAGDHLRSTDSGFVLTADATARHALRLLTVSWTVPAQRDAGVATIRTGLPRTTQSVLEIVAPAGFSDVSAGDAILTRRATYNAADHYTYALNGSSPELDIRYTAPLKKTAVDTVAAEKTGPGIKKPAVSARQETVLLLSKGSCFTYTVLRLSVARAPIDRFTVMLPDSFTLLKSGGNGIRAMKQAGAKEIAVNLAFDLEGEYTFFIAGELPADSIVAVPAMTVREATRQSGRFALGVDDGSEARYLSMSNCTALSLSDFFKDLAPGFADSVAGYDRGLDNLALFGQYYKLPFEAKAVVRRHESVPVADAVADAGSIRTVISRDGKTLTQATFSIRQRNRQFITMRLPDSVSLWSATLDGTPISPTMDDSGRCTISMQRFHGDEFAGRPVMLEMTYLYAPRRIKTGRVFRLLAPVPGIPVGKLDWTVFYPEQWVAAKVTGSFTSSHTTIFGNRPLVLDRREQRSLYGRLQESNKTRQTNVTGATALSLMPGSPRHLYAYQILVVGERPWLELRFGSAAIGRFFRILEIIAIIAIVAVSAEFVRRRFFSKLRRSL